MSGRQSAATEAAVKTYRPGVNVRHHAKAYGIAYTTLYRALKKAKKGNGK